MSINPVIIPPHMSTPKHCCSQLRTHFSVRILLAPKENSQSCDQDKFILHLDIRSHALGIGEIELFPFRGFSKETPIRWSELLIIRSLNSAVTYKVVFLLSHTNVIGSFT